MGRNISDIEHRNYGIYLPVKLVSDVKDMCKSEGISFNKLVRSLLFNWCDERERDIRAYEDKKKVLGDGW